MASIATPLEEKGGIYTQVNGPARSGVAITSPSNQPATLSFYFTDGNGTDFRAGRII